MESLQIKTGSVSLDILDDLGNSRGVFTFNPTDIELAKKFLAIQSEFEIKHKEFQTRAATIDEKDTGSAIQISEEIVDYLKNLIDDGFGEGTSLLLFGKAKTLGMFMDFFEGITPYFEKASRDRISKYAPTQSK